MIIRDQIIFGKGDEAFSGLLEFAENYHITSAHFTAIGALNGATLAWFDPQRKVYKKIPIHGQVEVIGMSGDIALYQGRPVVHTHMIVGTSDGTTRGGHVLDAYGLMDSSIFYRRGRFGWQLNGYNPANLRYFTGSYNDVYVLPGSPRSIHTTLSWRF